VQFSCSYIPQTLYTQYAISPQWRSSSRATPIKKKALTVECVSEIIIACVNTGILTVTMITRIKRSTHAPSHEKNFCCAEFEEKILEGKKYYKTNAEGRYK